MTWALKRQLFYILVLVCFFGLIGFWVSYPYLNTPPSCVDGKQNGTETGVDCGGSCTLQCVYQVDKVSVLWSRAFEVIPGRYNAVAYLENHNRNTTINKIKYKFRFADKNNLFIGSREGYTTVPPNGRFAVFEPAIGLGGSVPVYTTFSFTEVPVWLKVPQDKIDQLKIQTGDIKLENSDSKPHLSATLTNNSFYNIPDVKVVVILYDESGNAINASSTYVDLLQGEAVVNLDYTWIEPFTEKIVSKELIPIYNIFNVKLK